MTRVTTIKIVKIFLALALVAGIVVLTSCSATANANTQSQDLNQNKLAPDFLLKDLNGNLVALSNFRGKPVFFNYWASWCPACIQEMPLIQSTYNDWTRKGLVLLTVNSGEDAATVQGFMKKNNYTMPALLDTQSVVGTEYNIYYIPVSVFIDKNGILKSRVVGAFPDKAALEKQLASIVTQ